MGPAMRLHVVVVGCPLHCLLCVSVSGGGAQSCGEASFSFSCLEGVLAAALQNFHLCFYVSSVRFTRLRRIKSLEH